MSRLRPLAAVLASVVLAATAAGCGLGAGDSPSRSALLVTQDFGARSLVDTDSPEVEGSDTVMRVLQRNAKGVTTRFGGGFVQSIDGVAGGQEGGRPVDWFFYVNGVIADKGAAALKVDDGDRMWWDHHDWSSIADVQAVVGQFPAPFTQSPGGRRLPTRVECIEPKSEACDMVHDQLVDLGLPAAKGGLAASFVQETLRVVVGPWTAMRSDDSVGLLSAGPRESGVFARPSDDGRRIALLDEDGRTVRTLGPGSGLIAAVKREESAPVWIVTGTDERGIADAAAAFQEGALAGHFAIALDGGRPVPLPVPR